METGIHLAHSFWPAEKGTYCGIDQKWSSSPVVQGWGCGMSGGLMVLGYLHLYHPRGSSAPMEGLSAAPSRAECTHLLDTVGRQYFPVIPRWGMNGLMLTLWMNRYFLRFRMPYRACWSSGFLLGERGRTRICRQMEEMLRADIPVIFSVGPDFPLVWQKHPVAMETPGGRVCRVRGHYMVLTGMENGWLCLSSWGRAYRMRLSDWLEHHRKHSGTLVDGIVYIRQTQ